MLVLLLRAGRLLVLTDASRETTASELLASKSFSTRASLRRASPTARQQAGQAPHRHRPRMLGRVAPHVGSVAIAMQGQHLEDGPTNGPGTWSR
jgi:hypothetical protein